MIITHGVFEGTHEGKPTHFGVLTCTDRNAVLLMYDDDTRFDIVVAFDRESAFHLAQTIIKAAKSLPKSPEPTL